MTTARQQGKTWVELLKEHIEDHHAKTIHEMLWDKGGIDYTAIEAQALAGMEPKFIIIDEARPLIAEELELLLKEFGVKEPKPKRPTKQPEWARHNQAPRSVRKRQ